MFQFDDLFHRNEPLCEKPFLGRISPGQVYWFFGCWESEGVDLLMDHRNLNKCKTLRKSDKTNLSLTNRLSLDREYTMQCSGSCTTPSPPHHQHHITLNTFYCNIQSLKRKFYFWNYFHFSSELKIILLHNYHWGS